MDKLDRIILGIGIGIFCAVIGFEESESREEK